MDQVINIGATSFKEHGKLLNKSNLTLADYASLFPVVEMNTSFYGIKSPQVSQKWIEETPASFKFSVKAFKVMTCHAKLKDYYESEQEMDEAFKLFLKPLICNNQLATILCQFPSYFVCDKQNVNYLKKLRHRFKGYPMSVEFRSDSWYQQSLKPEMIQFMKYNHLTLVTVDEPQVANHSIPFDSIVTNEELAYVRLHGRNTRFWTENSADWRKKRTLYRYNEKELEELAKTVHEIQSKETIVIFNNNSGGDAGENALEFKEILGIEYEGLNPTQLNLF